MKRKLKSIFILDSYESSFSFAFSTKKNAETVKGAINDPDYSVREVKLDECVSNIRKGYSPFQVLMLRNGSVEEAYRNTIAYFTLNESFFIWERTKSQAFKGKGRPDCLSACVWARNEKHAIQITNRHRLAMIKSGEWKG